MLFGTGTWRADFLVLHGYQLCQFYSSQQLFPISLNYVPPVKCVDDYCFEVKAKCYAGCPQCPDVCLNSTLLERVKTTMNHTSIQQLWSTSSTARTSTGHFRSRQLNISAFCSEIAL
ncbi:hypothetical protein RB195_001535 [Necator americanus]|uniref:4Fe-4S ferredoxin-type domain-containing protein n=1 Tax=Necator americanus TaxID=51031 RepID=A0ABR1DES7_NECAM